MKWRETPWSLRRGLFWLSLACMVPLVIYANVLLLHWSRVQKQMTEQQMLFTTRAVALTVERHIAEAADLLRVISRSENLRMGRFAAFTDGVWRTVSSIAGDDATINLLDGKGQLMLSSSGLKAWTDTHIASLLATATAREQDVLSGYLEHDGYRFVLLVRPVRYSSDGPPDYFVVWQQSLFSLSELLLSIDIPPGWLASVLDANGRIVARTQKPEVALGKPGPEKLLERLRQDPSGVVVSPTFEMREEYVIAFSPIHNLNWSALVASERQALLAASEYAVTGAIIGGLLLTALGLYGGMLIMRGLYQPLQDLVTAARAIGRGEVPRLTMRAKRLKETREIAEGLESSAERIAQTLREREATLAELKQLASTLEQRVSERTAELEQARHAAENSSQAKSDFFARMSHEIRTPLTGALAVMDLMRTEKLDEQQSERVELLRRNILALQRLLSDILDFAKIDADKLELESMPFSPQAVVRDAVALIEPLVQKKGLALNVHTEGLVPRVVGDPHRLRQVLGNLLSNALTHTRQGSISVRAWAADHGSTLGFEVRDTGVGFSDEVKEHLFDPFAQASAAATRTYGGVGLGLPICKQLVGIMGGTLTADGALGRGAQFAFTIRVQPLGVQSADADDADAPALAGRILVAEDNPTNRPLIVSMLERMGHLVDAVSDGREAVEALRHKHYDVIVMDVQMPGMSGVEAAQLIREFPHDKAVAYIIALSADGGAVARRTGVQLFDAYEPKPIDWTQLERKIQRGIALQMAREGLEVPAAPGGSRAAAPPPEAIALLVHATLEQLREKLGASRLASLIADLPPNLMGQLQQTVQAFEAEDLARAEAGAHGIYGTAALLGLSSLANAAQAMQRYPTAEHLFALQECLPRTLEAIRGWAARNLGDDGAGGPKLTRVR